jgi:hypothetical protein
MAVQKDTERSRKKKFVPLFGKVDEKIVEVKEPCGDELDQSGSHVLSASPRGQPKA